MKDDVSLISGIVELLFDEFKLLYRAGEASSVFQDAFRQRVEYLFHGQAGEIAVND